METLTVCKNCGSANINNFCAECGQEVFKQRFTVKRLLREWISAFYNYSGGILFTVKSLVFKPGETIRNYVSGITIRYWNPFNYFVITFTVFLLFSIKFGIWDSSNSDYKQFTSDYAAYLVIFTIPFYSLVSYILFKESGYNYAENLVLNIFIAAQQNIYDTVLLLLNIVITKKQSDLISIFIGFIYLMWVYKSFFNSGFISTILKAFIVYITQAIVLTIYLVIIYVLTNFI